MTASLAAMPSVCQTLLYPRSIALVGASDDVKKTGGRPLQFLRRSGFAGTIYPINPNRAQVQGEQAWPSLAALPQVPDHVFVLSPTETVIDTVRECARLGVSLVTILASGFSESGAEGVQREAELRAIARNSTLRILGPSSLGVVNPHNGLVLTANAAFAEPDVPRGKVFVASHSGSMIGALVSRGKARGVGFAGLVSVGSEVDLSVGEICAATLDDPAIEGYALFLESLRHGDQLQAFAREAARRGKPVIAYKLGRSSAAAEMATTHTGALAGEDDIADAFLKDLGIVRVDMLETLFEVFPLAQKVPLQSHSMAGKRIGVVTTTGGGAAMVVDQLGLRGITVQPVSDATLAKLKAAQVPGSAGRVLDLTLAGTRYEVMKSVLDIMLEAPEFDMVVAVVGSSARFQPDLAVKPIMDSAGHAKPLVTMLVPDAPQALAALTQAGMPCFRTPESCADAIAAVLARRVPHTPVQTVAAAPGMGAALSEAQAYQLLDRLQVPHAPAATFALDGQPGQLPFDFPVVAKVCSPEIPHKTEVGGVVLGIQNPEQLVQAFATLRANLAARAPGVACNEVLVQPLRKGLTEVLLGYRIDPDAGPIVMLAAGGIWAEVMRDRSIRLAPVSVDTAREMIAEVKLLQTVSGLRGKARGDLEALAQAISDLSQLALQPVHGVLEAEVNPLMVMPEGQGVLAVDALVLQAR
ncbi:acetate--CoA ligase family protein [Comamonas terrigena]|uniref:acetate--CoA ligase family protein n=1 Tax=Comamonas terrigena TaxID=32013 RepID=UPI00244BD175|nr:acetate--CoA ligase [Comamonas terrigena]MDH0048384.1 acetate--CoA ligase family protein [Comamonas terrigena]MDH0510792.1 acetate--CoA ligase family protein [Comamonas terrigena]MDH1090301.1 acetate--CoA ligase family protein [Comamonas terrigena]MDH1499544.1 acetate--CoA ligase family protein [Comamonas terrigena]